MPSEAPRQARSTTIATRRVADATVVDLPAEVRGTVSEDLAKLVRFLVRQHTPVICLNFSEVIRIESSGIALCLVCRAGVQGYGGRLALIGLSDRVMRLFTIARLHDFFEFFPDVESAVAGPAPGGS